MLHEHINEAVNVTKEPRQDDLEEGLYVHAVVRRLEVDAQPIQGFLQFRLIFSHHLTEQLIKGLQNELHKRPLATLAGLLRKGPAALVEENVTPEPPGKSFRLDGSTLNFVKIL